MLLQVSGRQAGQQAVTFLRAGQHGARVQVEGKALRTLRPAVDAEADHRFFNFRFTGFGRKLSPILRAAHSTHHFLPMIKKLLHTRSRVRDLEQFAAQAAAQGYPLSDGPHRSSSGSVIAFIDAPEGYEIELIQRARS